MELAAEFEAIRPRLVGVAYGLLGSLGEAEDVVQEAWLRLSRTAHAEIDDVTGWLVVTVSRLALDVLRSARVRREEYVGPWLPEPVVEGGDPADRVTLDESMSLAMLVVLESLSPAERTAFVLHDVFGLAFDEVGRVVGRTPAACRQLAARARRHVRSRGPRFEVDPAEHRKVVTAFAGACLGHDLDALLTLLDPTVVLRSDGGGVVTAARRVLRGADRVARFLVGVMTRRARPGYALEPTTVNGEPGLCWTRDGEVKCVIGIAVVDGRVTEIYMVLNPEKLGRVQ
ncbi:RNA polymerase sigma-70 factor, ECF subfamily [Sinosporangium album]|uniref:RNA polymerase sigma-70 factor, ECF subfamily n=1 Tax=Sinosporangium album TaxID=504805 RepID=A0A1G7RBQ5_9ACTN|nr:RNA polymerase sigma-70 factor, ECF subfamily [Sinosporangium album]